MLDINIASTERAIQHAYDIRTRVFVDEQHVPMEEEIDKHESEAIHFVGYENEIPVAASRLRFVDGFGKLERICILKDHRNKSYGSKMIQAMEDYAQKQGYTKSKLNAQTHAIDFYKKLGYNVISTETFLDAGIPHVTMEKSLTKVKQ